MKVLKSQQLIEKDTVTLACELDDAAGEVTWFKGDEEIKPDKRVKVVKDGRKRKLVIGDAKVTDAGQYSCVSNADKTQAEIVINCKYDSIHRNFKIKCTFNTRTHVTVLTLFHFKIQILLCFRSKQIQQEAQGY